MTFPVILEPLMGPLADPDVATRIDIADHVVLHVGLVPVDDSAGVGLVDDVLRDRGLALEVVDADRAGDRRIEDVVDVVARMTLFSAPRPRVDGAPSTTPGSRGDVVVFDHVVPRVQVLRDQRQSMTPRTFESLASFCTASGSSISCQRMHGRTRAC